MKQERPLINRLGPHILVSAILLFLVIGFLEGCSESYNHIIPNSKRSKDSKSKSVTQPPSSNNTEASKGTYLQADKKYDSYFNKLPAEILQEGQLQPNNTSANQHKVTFFDSPTDSFIENENDTSNIVELSFEKDQQLASKTPINQNKGFLTKDLISNQHREAKKQAMQEKEAQLINKVFRVQGGYIVRFYKERNVWKAEVTDDKSTKFHLRANLGKDEELIKNINRLLDIYAYQPDKPPSKLIQVVFPTASQPGVVYIGGLLGGSRKKIKRITVSSSSSSGEGEKEKEQEDNKQEQARKELENKLKNILSQLDKLDSKKDKAKYNNAKESLLSFPWEQYKQYLGNQGTTEQGSELLEWATIYYKKIVKTKNSTGAKALIKLRDLGLYVPNNLDKDAIEWYQQAVESAIPGKKLNFEQFQKRAKHQFKRSIEDLERKKKKRTASEPSWQGPMRISDLIVMNLDASKAPGQVAWGGNYDSFKEANADMIFGPLFEYRGTHKYEDAIMTIDPSGKGTDETAYCVAKRFRDHYYIMDVGGMAGSYARENLESEDEGNPKHSLGNSPEVLKELILIAQEYGVSRIIVENNNDKSFARLLEKQMLESESSKGLKTRVIKFDSVHQGKNKEERILETLRPLLIEHRIVINREALKKDFESKPQDNLHYKFFYQLMSVVKNKIHSASYFDGGKPLHDDRVDAVADAIRYLKDRKDNLDNTKEDLKKLKGRSKKGNIDAQFELARRYKDGIGVSENFEAAIELYELIAGNKNIEKKKDKYTEALFNLAQLYQIKWKEQQIQIEQEKQQKGKEKNKSEGYSLEQISEFYKRAADQGHAGARYELGRLYEKGLVKQKAHKGKGENKTNASIAIKMFEIAADKGHAKAAYRLGKIYQNGLLELEKNPIKAMKYYITAADKGNIKAKLNLANIYYEGRDIKQDHKKAKRYYKETADFGYLEAQIRLADMYYEDQEGQNYTKAFKWYQRAAIQGSQEAQYRLGKMYENAWGIKRKDLEQALHWYKAAAEQEHIDAQFEAGRLYENMDDYIEASEWYTKAAGQGHAEACFKLGNLLLGDKLGEMNETRAIELFETAADQGHANAKLRLALMYSLGKGVEKDEAKALEYYESEDVLPTEPLENIVKRERADS